MGDVKFGGDRVCKWDFLWAESGSTTTVDLVVHDSEGLLATVDAKTSDGVSTANVSFKQESQLQTLGGVRLELEDSSAQLQLLVGASLQKFFQLDAGIGSSRLLTDWEATVAAQLWDPAQPATLLMSGSVQGTSSGGTFTTETEIKNGAGAQVMTLSTTGTSGSDQITTQGITTQGPTAGTAVTLTLSKPDGRLDTLTQLDFTATVDNENTDISVGMGYDGIDTWDVSGIASGMASLECHVHEDWASASAWVDEDTIGVGTIYGYVNSSTADSSDMWEHNYIQVGDFIETTNVTRHTDASAGESSLSVRAYAMQKDDSGEWQYIYSLNVSGVHAGSPAIPTPAPPAPSTKTVDGTFKAKGAASGARDFVSMGDTTSEPAIAGTTRGFLI
jgi:hypothetical protein